MTTEEKAKRYDEAIEIAEKWYNAPNVDKIPTFANRVIEEIFPELKENEDEKMIKWLIEAINFVLEDGRVFHNKVIDEAKDAVAWLEKQSKQKPNWSEEDESMYIRCIGILGKCYMGELPTKVEEELNWLKSLKERVLPQPKQEWSEKDEERRKKIIHILSLDGRIKNEELSDINDWLKSLKDKVQPKQEWSEEDMIHLSNAIIAAEGEWGPESATAAWLASLENRIKLQKWSEEDETHRHWILEMLKAGEINTPEFADQFKSAFNWLKSFH